MSRGIEAIIFDMDGVMVDTEPLYWTTARRMAAGFDTHLSDQTLRRMMGCSRIDAMRIFAEDCRITGIGIEALLVERERILCELYSQGVQPMPGLLTMLRQFHGRLKLGVATSSPRRFTDIILPSIGAVDYFDVVCTGDQIVNGKPDPEIYLKAIRKLNAAPERTCVIEDSLAGATAARRAGTIVIAAPTALTASEDFSFADARVNSLAEAAAWIERRTAAAT